MPARRAAAGGARGGERAPAKGAGRRSKGAGRGRQLAVLLVSFLVVATGVIWRRTYGIARSRELVELDRRRAQLESRRAQLESEIRDLSSRARLAPIVERTLQMHVPTDSQVVILPRPSRERNR